MKKLLACLLVACSLLAFGCSSRNATFGVVDMKKVESDSEAVKVIKKDFQDKATKLQDEMQKETEGKSNEEAQKVVTAKSQQMQAMQAEAQSKLKASLDKALAEIAKEKNLSAVLYKDVVPQGGTDVTDEVIQKMK